MRIGQFGSTIGQGMTNETIVLVSTDNLTVDFTISKSILRSLGLRKNYCVKK